MSNSVTITPFQERVYTHLLTIPRGQIASYAALARSLNTSPRAVGGALRNNPYAPTVPCHRVIAASSFVGGFKGDWEKAPSGINQTLKLHLLREEGVNFDKDGKLIHRAGVWYDGPWEERAKQGAKELNVIRANWKSGSKNLGTD